ncbi:MAG: zinc-ribbon domain-containing protein, partial [Planctomycetota bacterium]|nr:zinc-ribbon domain-containing protein [Planctomycetota bacterium]
MQAPAGTGQNPVSPILGVGMSFELQCPECQSTLRVADENIGKRSKCPSCAHVFTVDGASGVASPDATRTDQRNQEMGNPLVDPLVDRESFTDGVARDPVDWQMGSTPNPYSPISSQVNQTVELGPITPTVVTIDQVLEAAIALFRKHWVAVCLTVGIVAAVNYGVNFFYNILTAIIDNTPLAGEEWLIGINVVVFLLISILGLWLQLGQSLVMLDISRGRVADYGRIFAAASFLPSAIGAWFIRYSLLGLVVLAFAGIPSGLAYLMTGELETPILVGLVGACLGAVPFFILLLG